MPTLPKPTRKPNKVKTKSFNQVRDKRYDKRRWRKLRAVFIRRHPMCSFPGCNKAGEVVDHIDPIRQGGAMYDWANLQTLCHKHHNSKSATERQTNMMKHKRER